ncbi:hypothetical protein [Paraburkholderia rhynchosiae]|uniref:Uncharacterized protein n=1 Tax=Paraburkholderia rhynchosiae TaxID=487049 RepID=A0A2N7WJ72_9BURK|nr:hypothetical protein [Paraburkholderia rhynchosiae]PMS29499.1 hypothetical protein C0Z16_18180 [Paraburkholderia rhynchosiae]CAB3706004.1 hypothetical protein LMG27174_03945 [Paraburkholderia rhynchosiae]
MNIANDINPSNNNPSDVAQIDAPAIDMGSIYESVLRSLAQMFASYGITQADLDDNAGSELTRQSASGALASYMHENGINTLNPDQLYKLACGADACVQSGVSDAARYMLQNPDIFNQIETHDVAGADGIAGVNDFDWAAQGGLGDVPVTLVAVAASQTDEQDAAGALASYMRGNGINTLNPNALYRLAYNPPVGTSLEVSAAASWMLQNADAFNRIETHDVPGADGIAGVNDFDWAAANSVDQSSLVSEAF